MLVRTLKRCSGVISFAPDSEIDIPDELVSDLVAAGAVVCLFEPKVEPAVIESDAATAEVNSEVAVEEKPAKRKRR